MLKLDRSGTCRLTTATLLLSGVAIVTFSALRTAEAAPSPAPVELQVTIMSYNTHLWGNLNGPVRNVLVNAFEQKTYQDNLRADELIKRILASNADIVVLQEVWDHSLSGRIKDGVAAKYPNSWRAGKRGRFNPVKALIKTDKSQMWKFLGSGLLILARAPFRIHDTDFDGFEDLKGVDQLARKGCGKALVTTGAGGKQVTFAIIFTHTQAQAKKHPEAARKCLMRLRDRTLTVRKNNPGIPVILAGDLNTTAEDEAGTQTEEYRTLLFQQFGEARLEDAWRVLYPNAVRNPGFTHDRSNIFSQNLSGKPHETNKRIDYFFFNRTSLDGTARITPRSMEVIKDYKYSDPKRRNTNDLSDHFPIKATFAIQVR